MRHRAASAPSRPAPPRSLTLDAVAAAVLAAGVVALGVYGLAFQALLPVRLPSPSDWREAAAFLAREGHPGDAVALSPWWAERAREIVPETLLVLARPTLAGEDLVGLERVWLLELPTAPGYRDDLQRELTTRGAPVALPHRAGPIRLTPYALGAPVLPLAFLPDRLAAAKVSVGTRPCAADARGRFRCPAPPFVTVATEVRELDFAPHRCVLAHPSPDRGAPLTITFPRVPLGRSLRGHTGIVGEAAYSGRAAVRLSVRIGGEEVAVIEEPPGKPSWRRYEIGTAHQAGGERDVSFTVTAEDVAARHFCFDAYTLP